MSPRSHQHRTAYNKSSATLLPGSVAIPTSSNIRCTDLSRLIIYRGAPFALTEPVLTGTPTPLNTLTNKQHAARYQGAFPL
jgi:hypothetical protein